MQPVFAMNDAGNRKLRFLYQHGGIDYRYSVIPDYGRNIKDWKFYPASENLEPFPTLEKRMEWFNKYAAPLSVAAIRDCLQPLHHEKITHLMTVSCTGMSAPGLDLQVMELMDFPKNTYRTSINFMGCYAAIHALKLADAICNSEREAKVLIVCTELCTLHFQREPSIDNLTSSLLFGDGAAAVLVTHDNYPSNGLMLEGFYSEVISRGKRDMAWELSSSGFLMTLSGYIPQLLEEDFEPLVSRALAINNREKNEITHWCIHPGGKRILEGIHRSLHLQGDELRSCYEVLKEFGNMSSPSILFVLKKLVKSMDRNKRNTVFGAAFGPGLTMETFLASTVQ